MPFEKHVSVKGWKAKITLSSMSESLLQKIKENSICDLLWTTTTAVVTGGNRIDCPKGLPQWHFNDTKNLHMNCWTWVKHGNWCQNLLTFTVLNYRQIYNASLRQLDKFIQPGKKTSLKYPREFYKTHQEKLFGNLKTCKIFQQIQHLRKLLWIYFLIMHEFYPACRPAACKRFLEFLLGYDNRSWTDFCYKFSVKVESQLSSHLKNVRCWP